MDRTLKERIIGAIVLVVFAVLVVPIFLDGPPGEDEIVSETVTLPGQSEQKMQTRVLERNRSTPEPKEESRSGRETAIVEAPEPEETGANDRETAIVEAPEPEESATSGGEPAIAEAPAPKETSATGMWAVQLGAFSDRAKADKLAADLRQQGFAAFLTKVSTDKGQLHRVRIGPQADRAAAEAVAKKLESSGHKSRVVPHP
ncbi:MAG: SPOR domain-containing protein [Woeseiaceae bacterium]|nr:SPOR domain-containing protein [Woeseiaceae bacterium]